METSTNLGRVSLVPRGEYDPQAQYQRLDIVRYGGSSYLALRDLQGVTPEDGTDYMLISEKGGKGDRGVSGDAAGFGAVSATVDDTSGTPSVDVSSAGPDTAKEFSFAFHGLKGEQGIRGVKGDTGETGNGIASIERTSGTGAAGTTDTYTITMTDGSTAEFQVYNGADGAGAGDMTKSVYDPKGRSTDIFAYVDDAMKNVKVDVDEEPTKDSQNPVSSGGTYAGLATKQDTLTGLPGQVVRFDGMGLPYAAEGWSGRNLIINWDLRRPVNRQGKTEYTGSGSYCIDRCHDFLSHLEPQIRRDEALAGGQHQHLALQILVLVVGVAFAPIVVAAVGSRKVGGIVVNLRSLAFEELVNVQVSHSVDGIAKYHADS